MAERLGNVVILAGGASSRMGMPKGLLMREGRPFIEHQLDSIDRFAAGRPIVVLGFDHARYTSKLRDLEARAVVVVNPAPERGPFSSLQLGLSRAAPRWPTFVLPIDVPTAGQEVWGSLASAMRPAVEAAVPVHEGRGGHPVLLSHRFVARLTRLRADRRLDFELRRSAVVRVAVGDPRVCCNLNSIDDWLEFERGADSRPDRHQGCSR